MTEESMESGFDLFREKQQHLKNLFTTALEMYTSEFCQCAYPRYQQLIGIDCIASGDSFVCYETEMLIDLSRPYFDIDKSRLTDENTNETWKCKKCQSTYEYGWSDLSIHVERQKLKLTHLKTVSAGKGIEKPIPLYLGLHGHSYPPATEMTPVDFDVFEKYILEKGS